MEESNVEEINLIIKQQLKVGKTFDEIADNTGKSKWYIGILKKQLILDGEITDEEIETARNRLKEKTFITDPQNQRILRYARLGLSQSDIAYEVKSTQTKISRILMQFKAYGVITQEEINDARASYKKEIKYDDLRRDRIKEALEAGRLKSEFASEVGVTERGAKVIQDSLIEEGRITQSEIDEAVATKGKETKKRNRVIELLRQGYLYKEVTEVVGYCPITVRRIKDKAISDGIFTEEEYQQQRVQRRLQMKKEPKKAKVDDEELSEKVLQMLKMGKDMFYMRRKTGKSKLEIQTAQKKLIKEGRITDEEIKTARKNAAEELERKVLIGLKKGETQREIVDSFGEGEYTLQAIQTAIERLKANGKITDEQIAIYKYEAEQGEKELQEFVLLGIKQGLSRAKMIESDETGYYTESRIKWAIKKMKQQGILTDKDIKQGLKARRKNEQNKAKKKRKEFYKSVLVLLYDGYNVGEIAAKLGYKEETIRAKVFDLKKYGKITQEAIDKARKIRVDKEKNAENELVSNYKNNLKRAERFYKGDKEPTDAQRNALVEELIGAADMLVQTGEVSKEELKLMFDVLIDANDIQLSNILGISRIYLKMDNYQGAVYTLNYSRSLFSSEEDLKQIDKTLEMISRHKRIVEAQTMFQQGCSFDAIQKRTQIETAELLVLQNSLKSAKKRTLKEDNKEKEIYK